MLTRDLRRRHRSPPVPWRFCGPAQQQGVQSLPRPPRQAVRLSTGDFNAAWRPAALGIWPAGRQWQRQCSLFRLTASNAATAELTRFAAATGAPAGFTTLSFAAACCGGPGGVRPCGLGPCDGGGWAPDPAGAAREIHGRTLNIGTWGRVMFVESYCLQR